MPKASVARSVERNDLEIQRLQVKFLGVAFFTTGPGWLLKCIYLSDTQVYYTLL